MARRASALLLEKGANVAALAVARARRRMCVGVWVIVAADVWSLSPEVHDAGVVREAIGSKGDLREQECRKTSMFRSVRPRSDILCFLKSSGGCAI